MSLQLAVILVPVLFGFMGFALDLGRIYLIRGELNQAANAMALQAASQLLGTAKSAQNVQDAIQSTNGPGYSYNFGTIPIGGSTTNLTSTIDSPTCFAAVADASSSTGQSVDCGAAEARVVQVSITADAPLLFFSLLPGGQSRKTPIVARANAGISAPLCTACGIVPLAVTAIDTSDTVNFGFDSTFSTVYTLYQQCTGTAPANLTGTTANATYLLINRYDTSSATLPDEFDQAYQAGANGVAASSNPAPNTTTNTPNACVNVGDVEQVWASATPAACTAATSQTTQALLCGIYSRLDKDNTPAACQTAAPDFQDLSDASILDTEVDPALAPPYSGYGGNGRRIITVAIVDSSMTILGFRQFLVMPNPDNTFFNPTDTNGRFPALYIGSPAPIQSGWFDTRYANACPADRSGPGRVVLH